MLFYLTVSFVSLLLVISCIIYLRYKESRKLDRMVLQNLLTEEERRHFIAEHRKAIAAKTVYELLAEKKFNIEIAREIVKERRDK